MPCDYRDYPASWKALSHRIRFERAEGRCECEGECGSMHGLPEEDQRCSRRNGDVIRTVIDLETGKDVSPRVVLTVAHLWRGPCTCHPKKCGIESHLKAMCQACHLRYDLPHHQARARETRRRKKGEQPLPFVGEGFTEDRAGER